MRKCYATAAVLISWFLMLPPPVYPPVKDASGDYKMNTAAPMSQWLTFKTLKSEAGCKAQLKKVQPFYKCVSSDDPALKKKAPAAAGAPSVSTVSGAAASHMQ
ncbi:hypothetical protein [Candidatus Binatus sp.]|uniref:hypothetical protein n=1 Tax=Candidatus Binatus sp. TaxID=2811406 RepID=UPI003CC50BF2